MSTPVTVAETQEKTHRSKTKQADPQSGYLEEKIVGSEYINITEEDGSVGKRLVVEVDAAAIVSGVVDHKVKVDTSDVAEFLENKITAGTAIAITEKTVSGKKNLEIAGAYTAGVGISITDDEIASTITQVVTEDPFTGHATKVPTSKAVSDLLQTCMITDDDDLGTGGDALMWHAEFMEPSKLLLITDTDATASNILDSSFPKASSMIATTPVVGYNGYAGYRLFGNFKIITVETPAEPHYNVAFAKFFTHEFYAKDFPLGVGKNLYLDLFLKLPATGVALSELKLKIHPYYVKEGDSDFRTFYVPQTLTVQYDGSGTAIYQWEKVSLTGLNSDANPQAIAFFITVQSEDATPTATYTTINEVEIAGVRLRYPKRTIGLRKADVDI